MGWGQASTLVRGQAKTTPYYTLLHAPPQYVAQKPLKLPTNCLRLVGFIGTAQSKRTLFLQALSHSVVRFLVEYHCKQLSNNQNLCCLVHSMYELGVEVDFSAESI
jgi:hypothetical protein